MTLGTEIQRPPCHSSRIPLWLVLLDNIPTLLLLVLGFLIINQVSLIGAIAYGIYAVLSIIWFWARICPYCHHYDTYACPCGYGKISAQIFTRKDNNSFRKVFRRNIAIQFPNWFVPLAFAVHLINTAYSELILYLTISFVVVGFIVIPVISKLVGCRNCEIKEDCPWMAITSIHVARTATFIASTLTHRSLYGIKTSGRILAENVFRIGQ